MFGNVQGSLSGVADKEERAVERDKVDKILDLTKEQVERKFGKGSLMRLGEHANVGSIPAISTGSIALDAALGIGGVPRGRIALRSD